MLLGNLQFVIACARSECRREEVVLIQVAVAMDVVYHHIATAAPILQGRDAADIAGTGGSILSAFPHTGGDRVWGLKLNLSLNALLSSCDTT